MVSKKDRNKIGKQRSQFGGHWLSPSEEDKGRDLQANWGEEEKGPVWDTAKKKIYKGLLMNWIPESFKSKAQQLVDLATWLVRHRQLNTCNNKLITAAAHVSVHLQLFSSVLAPGSAQTPGRRP